MFHVHARETGHASARSHAPPCISEHPMGELIKVSLVVLTWYAVYLYMKPAEERDLTLTECVELLKEARSYDVDMTAWENICDDLKERLQ